jgi:chromate reductase
MEKKKVGVLVGSLRRGSYSRSIARAAAALAPEKLELHFIDISQLPLYNEDLDDNPPEAWVDFRRQLSQMDGFLFVTPEYNRSIPAALKNALDVGSRPFVSSVWDGKPGGIISVSPGSMGGFGSNHQLRQVMMALNVPMLQQPEAYIKNVARLLDEQGELTDESTRRFLKRYMDAFSKWVEKITCCGE